MSDPPDYWDPPPSTKHPRVLFQYILWTVLSGCLLLGEIWLSSNIWISKLLSKWTEMNWIKNKWIKLTINFIFSKLFFGFTVHICFFFILVYFDISQLILVLLFHFGSLQVFHFLDQFGFSLFISFGFILVQVRFFYVHLDSLSFLSVHCWFSHFILIQVGFSEFNLTFRCSLQFYPILFYS